MTHSQTDIRQKATYRTAISVMLTTGIIIYSGIGLQFLFLAATATLLYGALFQLSPQNIFMGTLLGTTLAAIVTPLILWLTIQSLTLSFCCISLLICFMYYWLAPQGLMTIIIFFGIVTLSLLSSSLLTPDLFWLCWQNLLFCTGVGTFIGALSACLFPLAIPLTPFKTPQFTLSQDRTIYQSTLQMFLGLMLAFFSLHWVSTAVGMQAATSLFALSMQPNLGLQYLRAKQRLYGAMVAALGCFTIIALTYWTGLSLIYMLSTFIAILISFYIATGHERYNYIGLQMATVFTITLFASGDTNISTLGSIYIRCCGITEGIIIGICTLYLLWPNQPKEQYRTIIKNIVSEYHNTCVELANATSYFEANLIIREKLLLINPLIEQAEKHLNNHHYLPRYLKG